MTSTHVVRSPAVHARRSLWARWAAVVRLLHDRGDAAPGDAVKR